jgi:hypothetical protein
MLSVIYAECHIQTLNAKWHYAECRYAECRGATFSHYLKDNQSFIFIAAQVASKSDLSGTTKCDQNHICDISKPKVGAKHELLFNKQTSVASSSNSNFKVNETQYLDCP